MNSFELLQALLREGTQPLKCQKRTDLQYKLITQPFATTTSFRQALKRPFTLIAYSAFSHLVKPDTIFTTKLPGDGIPEQRFNAKVFINNPDSVLIVGPVGEVYHVNIKTKFKYVRKTDSYHPLGESRMYIAIDESMFRRIATILNASTHASTQRILYIPTSWGATHILKRGDVLIVEPQGVYRINGSVFAATYRGVEGLRPLATQK
jgi:hypothetical protein